LASALQRPFCAPYPPSRKTSHCLALFPSGAPLNDDVARPLCDFSNVLEAAVLSFFDCSVFGIIEILPVPPLVPLTCIAEPFRPPFRLSFCCTARLRLALLQVSSLSRRRCPLVASLGSVPMLPPTLYAVADFHAVEAGLCFAQGVFNFRGAARFLCPRIFCLRCPPRLPSMFPPPPFADSLLFILVPASRAWPLSLAISVPRRRSPPLNFADVFSYFLTYLFCGPSIRLTVFAGPFSFRSAFRPVFLERILAITGSLTRRRCSLVPPIASDGVAPPLPVLFSFRCMFFPDLFGSQVLPLRLFSAFAWTVPCIDVLNCL